MQVPEPLSRAFGEEFEKRIAEFSVAHGLIPNEAELRSHRFISRSIVPHILKLSGTFNRLKDGVAETPEDGLAPYWKESSNPANLRLSYFLYFMPSNLYRIASIWAELARLGYRWRNSGTMKAIEFGAGPAAGACGVAAGESHAPVGLPREGNWALIEQDKSMLELGTEWAMRYFADQNFGDWGTRPFHRKIEWKKGLLPRSAPSFSLWVMSYFMNESQESPELLAKTLVESWDRHLDDEGLVILCEPALKAQSRRLLALRQALLTLFEKRGEKKLKVLLPCLGHQACGALAKEDDWCHEEVMWWRPPYFREIDKMAGLDRKSLPFSYLVIAKSELDRDELLPKSVGSNRFRLVSPAHSEGQDLEFFVCGQEGKRRARYRPVSEEQREAIGRGTFLIGADLRGDVHASRVQTVKKIE